MSEYINGILSGALGVIACHPFDTLKTWDQLSITNKLNLNSYNNLNSKNNLNIKNNLNSYNNLYSKFSYNININNLYRGLTYPLITFSLINGFAFGNNCNINKRVNNSYISGGITGGLLSLIINPIELYKIQRQQNRIPKDILSSMNAHRGLPLTLSREVIACSIYFGTYDNFKNLNIPPIIGGSIAGLLSWVTIYPLDVIKTRVQADYSISYKDAILQKKLWVGVNHCSIRAIVNNAVVFYTYEKLTDYNSKKNVY